MSGIIALTLVLVGLAGGIVSVAIVFVQEFRKAIEEEFRDNPPADAHYVIDWTKEE